MNFRKSFLVLSTLALLTSQSARAWMSFSVVGNVNRDSTASAVTLGGGLLMGVHMIDHLMLESGGLFLNTLVPGAPINSILVPSVLRYYFTREVSLSAGTYANFFTSHDISNEYGWRTGGRVSIQRWFVDGTYSRSFRNTSGDTKNSTIMALIGFYLGAVN